MTHITILPPPPHTPDISHYPHVRLRDPRDIRAIASTLLAPLADNPGLDSDGSLTRLALEIAGQILLLTTDEQRKRLDTEIADALRCETDPERLHAWRRLAWTEILRTELHGLSGETRAARLSRMSDFDSLPPESLEHFDTAARALDNLREKDEIYLPEIP